MGICTVANFLTLLYALSLSLYIKAGQPSVRCSVNEAQSRKHAAPFLSSLSTCYNPSAPTYAITFAWQKHFLKRETSALSF